VLGDLILCTTSGFDAGGKKPDRIFGCSWGYSEATHERIGAEMAEGCAR